MKKQKTLKEEALELIKHWDLQFPLDYWYRKKYNIPFGSPEHRSMNFLDMYMDYHEEKLFAEVRKNKGRTEFDSDVIEYKNIDGSTTRYETSEANKKIIKMSNKEIDAEFESLDLSQFDDK